MKYEPRYRLQRVGILGKKKYTRKAYKETLGKCKRTRGKEITKLMGEKYNAPLDFRRQKDAYLKSYTAKNWYNNYQISYSNYTYLLNYLWRVILSTAWAGSSGFALFKIIFFIVKSNQNLSLILSTYMVCRSILTIISLLF